MERYLKSCIVSDLKKKMVFLAGPRQCGKTTLEKLDQGNLRQTSFNLFYFVHR